MAYDDFKEGCSVIKEYVDDQNKETVGKIPTKVSELTNDSKYTTESYVNTAIGNIAQPSSLPQTYKKNAVTLATSGWNEFIEIDWQNGKERDEYTSSGSLSQWYIPFEVQQGDIINVLKANNEWAEMTIGTTQQTNSVQLKLGHSIGNPSFTTNVGLEYVPSGDVGKRLYFYSRSVYEYLFTTIKIMRPSGAVTKTYKYTDADVKVNSEVRFTLDEANGKLAGQFGLKKTIDKEAGKLTFTADTLPTSAISGTLEIGETSTEGAAFVEGITSDTTGFIKATEENTFTKTQTFNGTESQAGIKTNAIDNENGNRVVYFNGTKQLFGSGAIPTQVRTSEQRLKLERPVSGGTGTEIVEVANVADIGSGGVVIKRKKFRSNVSDGTLRTDNKVSVVLTTTKNWATIKRNLHLNKADISPFSVGLDLQVGKTYSLTIDGVTYTTTCGFFPNTYVANGEAGLVSFGTGAQAKMLEFTIGENKLRIVDCAVPYAYEEIASPDVTYDGGQVKEAAEAMAYWTDLTARAISGEITLATSSHGYIVISDADITENSFVWFETEGTYAFATAGEARFGYAAENPNTKIVTYDIITGMGVGAACEQQTLPKVVNVCIAPSGWTENKIDSPTQGAVPSSFYSKPNLVYKDTAGAVAAATAGIEVYQTQACPTKFGIKRTSENGTIWAAVKLD